MVGPTENCSGGAIERIASLRTGQFHHLQHNGLKVAKGSFDKKIITNKPRW
jgi:hypothetical protein